MAIFQYLCWSLPNRYPTGGGFLTSTATAPNLGFRAKRKLVPLADQAAGSCSGLAPALLLSLGLCAGKCVSNEIDGFVSGFYPKITCLFVYWLLHVCFIDWFKIDGEPFKSWWFASSTLENGSPSWGFRVAIFVYCKVHGGPSAVFHLLRLPMRDSCLAEWRFDHGNWLQKTHLGWWWWTPI